LRWECTFSPNFVLSSLQVYSGDLSGGVLVQPSTLRDYDERDMFYLFLLPGNNENRKVVSLFWVSPGGIADSTMTKTFVSG
jgi:hypothetical protein